VSASDSILIFVDAAGAAEGWLRLQDGRIVERGVGLEQLPPLVSPETGNAVHQSAIVSGEEVTVHWLAGLGGLAPAQAGAAARIAAAEVSAQPIADLHVAVGGEEEERAERVVALVPALTMARWIGRLQEQGIDPDLMLPEPLLLPAVDEGFVRYDRAGRPLYRGRSDAFTMEPALAEIVTSGAPIAVLSDQDFEAAILAAVANPTVNLRQGAFAKRRRWKIDWVVVRRLAGLTVAILLVTLAIQIASILRYGNAADALETEAAALATSSLPQGSRASDPVAALRQQLTDVQGAAGYGALASALFAGINATPNAEVSDLVFDRDGSLRATIEADTPATLSALQQRVIASGFAAELGAMRGAGGRQIADLTVRMQ
jgi:general secretion pathway protein L